MNPSGFMGKVGEERHQWALKGSLPTLLRGCHGHCGTRVICDFGLSQNEIIAVFSDCMSSRNVKRVSGSDCGGSRNEKRPVRSSCGGPRNKIREPKYFKSHTKGGAYTLSAGNVSTFTISKTWYRFTTDLAWCVKWSFSTQLWPARLKNYTCYS